MKTLKKDVRKNINQQVNGSNPVDLKFKRVFMAASMTAACLSVMPVAAEDQSAYSQGLQIDEIIVTAQKRDESLQDTPVAVSAMSAEVLEQIGATDITQMTENVPNLNVAQSPGSPTSAAFYIRGLGALDPQMAMDNRVGIYVDGAYMARMNSAAFDLAGIRQVEVLRGPQGTLYGRNSTGGAISITTAEPSGEFDFKQQASIGNRGYWRSITSIDSPEVAGVAASLTYLTTQYDGSVKNTASRPEAEEMAGADDTDGYRLALRWEPSDSLAVNFSFSEIDKDATGEGIQLSYAAPTFPMGAANVSEHRLDEIAMDFLVEDISETRNTNLRVEWDLGWATLKSITAYSEFDRTGGNDMDGGEYIHSLLGEPIPVGLSFLEQSQQQFTQEFQLLGSLFDEQVDYILGWFYFEEQAKESSLNRNGITTTSRTFHTDYSSQALFGQASWRPETFDDKLRLTLGLRYSQDDKAADQSLSLVPDEVFSGEGDWSNLSYTLIADYKLTETVNAYAKVSTGYNSGGFNIRDTAIDPLTGTISFETPYDEEELITYELGLKAELLNKRVRVNAAAFYTEFEDMQTTETRALCAGGALFCTKMDNAGSAEIDGFELEVIALLTEGLSMEASYAYLNYEIIEFITSDGRDLSEQKVTQLSPDHSGSLALVYDFPQLPVGNLTARVDASYRGEVFFDSIEHKNEHILGDDRVLLNARLGLSDISLGDGTLRVALWGKNLENKEYKVHGINFGRFANNVYGEPRSYGLDFTYEFH